MPPGLSDALEFNLAAFGMIIFRSLVVYVALLVGLRAAGKRELGQMTPFDLVVILVISNAVQNAMVGQDTSLTGGLVAAFTLLGANWLLNRGVLRFSALGTRLIGSPSLLISHGTFVDEHLRREGVQREEVMMALREHGIGKIEEVDLAVLEVDGSISVVPASSGSQRTRHRLRGRKSII